MNAARSAASSEPSAAIGPATWCPTAQDQEAAEIAGAAAEIAAGSGVPYTFERRPGTPADAILSGASTQAAAGDGEPVIVVGRSGHAARHVLGSVPVRLLHHSSYPVLAIP